MHLYQDRIAEIGESVCARWKSGKVPAMKLETLAARFGKLPRRL